jgi:hypothetical protein
MSEVRELIDTEVEAVDVEADRARMTKLPKIGPAAQAILSKFKNREIDAYAAEVMLVHFGYKRAAIRQMLKVA